MKTYKFFYLMFAFVLAFSLLKIPAPVSAQEHSPSIQVWVSGRVDGLNWPENGLITLTIEDPATTKSPDFTDAQSTFSCWWDANQGCVNIDMGSFQFIIGQVMTMSDQNNNVRVYTITSLSLKITGIDAETDKVSGTADPNSALSVNIGNILGAPSRYVIADATGHWEAYFGDIGTGEPTFDIVPGTGIWVSQSEADGDSLSDYAAVPMPYIDAYPDRDRVQANEWPLDTAITITINGTDTYTTTMERAPWNPDHSIAEISLNDDLQAGDEISITGGGVTRTMTVSTLQVTNVDVSRSTVSGIGDVGQNVDVWVNGGPHLYPMPDSGGQWTADFTPFALGPGSEGYARQIDAAGNYTWNSWRVRTPSVDIDVTTNNAYANDWLVGTDVTISFDIPGSEEVWDYSKTVTVPGGWTGCGWCQFIINIDPAVFRIQAGQVVRITDGITTRQSTIPVLTVTSVDPALDTISGIAAAGSIVNMQVMYMMEPGSANRNPITDENGVWFADFAHPGAGSDEWATFNINAGRGFFWISTPADDYVSAKFQWGLGPSFSVLPEEEKVTTWCWPYGANLTLTIDNPATPDSPDLTRTQKVPEESTGWGGGTTFDNLNIIILPGFTVSLTDGLVTKTHTVTDLALIGVDPIADTVSGTAAPGSLMDNNACDENSCAYRLQVSAGNDHQWLADFSAPTEDRFDIRPGSEGNVQQSDEDGDATSINWKVPFDGDGDGLNDDVDACPYDNPNSYDADHDGCTDTATGLRLYLANFPENVISKNTKASLLSKVDSIIALLNRGNEIGAIGKLNDFINQVESQRGKKIPGETADLLIAYARNIIAGIP